MNVLILGANGQLGPYVVKALEGKHTLRLTDVNGLDETPHEYVRVDVSDIDAVADAAEGMDAIINLSVLRWDPRLAFDVNARGCYNAMSAAVKHGIRRVINTGPHYCIAGLAYERFDYDLKPDVPPQPGTNLYGLTKSLGQEICRIFTEQHDVYALTLLFYNFKGSDDGSDFGQDLTPFNVSWMDAGEAFGPALEVDLATLPSKCEVFNIFTDLPHGKFSNEKAKRLLGWQPTDNLETYWTRSGEAGSQ